MLFLNLQKEQEQITKKKCTQKNTRTAPPWYTYIKIYQKINKYPIFYSFIQNTRTTISQIQANNCHNRNKHNQTFSHKKQRYTKPINKTKNLKT